MTTRNGEKTTSAKKLLAAHKLPMDAATFNNGLILSGFLEIKTYLSSTGSGEEKYYIILTDAGLKYGKNKASGWHEFKTEPIFFDAIFPEAYCHSAVAIIENAKERFFKD